MMTMLGFSALRRLAHPLTRSEIENRRLEDMRRLDPALAVAGEKTEDRPRSTTACDILIASDDALADMAPHIPHTGGAEGTAAAVAAP